MNVIKAASVWIGVISVALSAAYAVSAKSADEQHDSSLELERRLSVAGEEDVQVDGPPTWTFESESELRFGFEVSAQGRELKLGTPFTYGIDRARPRGVWIGLVGGSRLVADRLEVDAESLKVETRRFGSLQIDRKQVAWILLRPRFNSELRLAQVRRLMERSETNRCWLEGGDLLEGVSLTTRTQVTGQEHHEWLVGMADRTVTMDESLVEGVSFASADSRLENELEDEPIPLPVLCCGWSDGSSLAVERVSAARQAESGVVLRLTAGLEVTVRDPADGLVSLRSFPMASERIRVGEPLSVGRVAPLSTESIESMESGTGAGTGVGVVDGGWWNEALVQQTIGTRAWKLSSSEGVLSGVVGLDALSARDRVWAKIFVWVDGEWQSDPVWEGELVRGAGVKEFAVTLEGAEAFAINASTSDQWPPAGALVWSDLRWSE